MVDGDSSHLWLALLFLYIISAIYSCAFFKFFYSLLIFSAFWFKNRRYCESSQNKPSETEGSPYVGGESQSARIPNHSTTQKQAIGFTLHSLSQHSNFGSPETLLWFIQLCPVGLLQCTVLTLTRQDLYTWRPFQLEPGTPRTEMWVTRDNRSLTQHTELQSVRGLTCKLRLCWGFVPSDMWHYVDRNVGNHNVTSTRAFVSLTKRHFSWRTVIETKSGGMAI
jgi:hypothetical protein